MCSKNYVSLLSFFRDSTPQKLALAKAGACPRESSPLWNQGWGLSSHPPSSLLWKQEPKSFAWQANEGEVPHLRGDDEVGEVRSGDDPCLRRGRLRRREVGG